MGAGADLLGNLGEFHELEFRDGTTGLSLALGWGTYFIALHRKHEAEMSDNQGPLLITDQSPKKTSFSGLLHQLPSVLPPGASDFPSAGTDGGATEEVTH